MDYFSFPYLGKTPEGSDRMLGFDMNCICDLEEAMGNQPINDLLTRAGFNFMRHLIWAGLKWQDPTITPERVGELIQENITDKKRDLEVIVDPALESLRKSGVLRTQVESKPKGKVHGDRPTKAAPAAVSGKEAPAPAEDKKPAAASR